MNNCWLPTENYLIENIDKIRHIPAVIVHGRYDIICPVVQAWDLHKVWPGSDLHIIPDAGHSIYEEGIKNKSQRQFISEQVKKELKRRG